MTPGPTGDEVLMVEQVERLGARRLAETVRIALAASTPGSAQQMCKQGTRPVLDRVQPTAIGSPPNSFRLREMASVPDSASVPSAERERGIEKTDELRRLKNARNRKFESISLRYYNGFMLAITISYLNGRWANPQADPQQFCRCRWTSHPPAGHQGRSQFPIVGLCG